MLFLCSSSIWGYIKKKNLDTSKPSQQSDIPTKILKQNSDYFAGYVCGNKNKRISFKIHVTTDLKLADVTPVYKNKSKNSKDNCRPVSILYNISKIYERCFMIKFRFSSILFCQNIRAYNVQHCLITLEEKC